MDGDAHRLAEAERHLEQARRILARPTKYDADEWMLLATLIGKAHSVVGQSQHANPDLRALLESVVRELREVTNDFNDPAFLRASGAARRRNRDLFSSAGECP